MEHKPHGDTALPSMDSVCQAKFIEELSLHGIVGRACRTAAVRRAVAVRQKRTDPDFAVAWDDAIEEAADVLEAEAWKRAVEGYVMERTSVQETITAADDAGKTDADEGASAVKKDGPKKGNAGPRPARTQSKLNTVEERRFSDAILVVLLKGARPDKYNPKPKPIVENSLDEIARDPDPPVIARGRAD